ncbi:MAG: hypothetical protein RIB47_06555 [Cyclobacteriaceae bacterium]
MKPPEEYFKIRKEGEYTVYEWQDNARMMVAGLIGIGLVVMSFVKTFIDHAAPGYIFFITAALVIAVLMFFWIHDRFSLSIGKDGLYVARGASVYLGSGLGRQYLKSDFNALYTKSPSNFNNFDFGNDLRIICLQIKSGRTVRLTNALVDERAEFLITELKTFFIFSNKPTPASLKMGPKLMVAWAICVVVGAITPRLLEVGEYAIEKQSNAMRVASGLLGMSFIFWILTATDAIFKEGELTQGHKVILFVGCFVPTALILGYLYLSE